jgi:tetratricopeptide (TPR) repeat protein
MATAHKRITRKALRQPDWFQVTTEKLYEIYETHRLKVLLGAAAIVALLLAFWGWQLFKQRQNNKAADEFSVATGLYHAQKYREAVSVFEEVEDYRWSHYAMFAYLYEANSYLALHDLNKALTAAQRFVNATSPDSLWRQIGLVTLGFIEESKGQNREALQHYAEAEGINGAFRGRALLGEARTSEQLGDLKTAITAYREYDKEFPGTPVGLRVAELEAKVASKPAIK